MAPSVEDDWSDSDDELDSDTQTMVQLGIPDGSVDDPLDLRDAAVSRIGGHPAFLTSTVPSFNDASCKNCSEPMELLVQVWCPLEDSPYDRALYVWGCARGVCQRLEGSIRAFRGLRYNEKYAKKLERQRRRKDVREQERTPGISEKSVAKSNPFSIRADNVPDPLGLGSKIFGALSDKTVEQKPTHESSEELENEDDEDDDEDRLVTAFAETNLSESEWATAPSYNAQYLSTIAEYLPHIPKPKIPAEAQISEQVDRKKGDDGSWSVESYENSLDTDQVFERFTKRVGHEGEQCIRYEFGGVPLPFSRDVVFDRFFPKPPAANLPITKPDFMVVPAQKREYNPSSLPSCPHCKGPRVFECQLMPNLINVLKSARATPEKKMTDAERQEEVRKALQKGASGIELGVMEWGTCMIFSCEKDCCVGGDTNSKNCWREELVVVQWDD